MNIKLDNKTILFIVISLFILQLLIMRYYVNKTIEEEIKNNNKKMVRKISKQISMIFREYLKPVTSNSDNIKVSDINNNNKEIRVKSKDLTKSLSNEIDSLYDPAEDNNVDMNK
jgi:type III secretory pathway component EscR